MTPHLIEIQDRSICIRNAGDVVARSPGFVSIAGDKPVFGDAALEQARLNPRFSFNHFWSQLSLDSLPFKSKHFRHTADMAYSHLDSMTRPLGIEHGAVLAVPSNYTRSQLGVLLGLIKQCAFEPVGLVDLALLQAAASNANDCIVIDLQLHQAVLSRFVRSGGHLIKDRVVPVPFAGLLALQDAWINMVCEEFVRQSRFDPRQNAEAEQYVANHLRRWMAQSASGLDMLAEINLKGSVHQAHLTHEQFELRVQPLFARINAELNELRHPDSALHVATSQVGLPGLMRCIPALIALDDDLVAANSLQHLGAIKRPGDNLQFVTRLPLASTAATTGTASGVQSRIPTHVVLQHRAIALPAGKLTFGTPAVAAGSARIVPVDTSLFSGAISLQRGARGVLLELQGTTSVLCNGKPAADGQTLLIGDRLQLGDTNGLELQMIVVEQAT